MSATNGDTAVVKQLITTRYKVNLAMTYGVTSFMETTKKGHRDVVKLLIVTRCDINRTVVNMETLKTYIVSRRDVNLRCGYDSKNESLTFSMVSRTPCPPNLCPCLFTVHPTKGHSVSFSDVFIGEICTL